MSQPREHGRRIGAKAAEMAPYDRGTPEWRCFIVGYVAGLLEEAFREPPPPPALPAVGSFGS